jgi:hypothetical protein
MTKMDLSLKINIKIYSYNTIKVIKHCFGGRILFAVFLFSRPLGMQLPDKAMGQCIQNFKFHTATLYVRLIATNKKLLELSLKTAMF